MRPRWWHYWENNREEVPERVKQIVLGLWIGLFALWFVLALIESASK
jgi:hypothetical protein